MAQQLQGPFILGHQVVVVPFASAAFLPHLHGKQLTKENKKKHLTKKLQLGVARSVACQRSPVAGKNMASSVFSVEISLNFIDNVFRQDMLGFNVWQQKCKGCVGTKREKQIKQLDLIPQQKSYDSSILCGQLLCFSLLYCAALAYSTGHYYYYYSIFTVWLQCPLLKLGRYCRLESFFFLDQYPLEYNFNFSPPRGTLLWVWPADPSRALIFDISCNRQRTQMSLAECCVCVPKVSACTRRWKNAPTCSTSDGVEPLVECQRFIASGAWNPPCNSRGCCALHRHQCKSLWKDITCSSRPGSLVFLSQAEIILQTGGGSQTLFLIFFCSCFAGSLSTQRSPNMQWQIFA